MRRECDHSKAPHGATACPDCGIRLTRFDVDIHIPADAAPVAPKPRPVRWWHRRQRQLLAAVLVIGAVAGLGYTVAEDEAFNPQEPVDELIAAVADGDGSRYRSLITDSPYLSKDERSALESSPLLRSGALANGYTPPSQLRVDRVSRSAPQGFEAHDGHQVATVSIGYELGGKRHTDEVVVWREGTFTDWRLAQAGGRAVVDAWHTASGKYRIASATTTDATGIPAMPGRYTITASGDAAFAAATVRRAIGFDTDTRIDFRTDMRDHLNTFVASSIERFLRRDCRTEPIDGACGFTTGGRHGETPAVPVSATWTITDYPQVDLEIRADSFAETGPVIVHTTTPGRATTTVTDDSGTTRTVTADIYAYGHLAARDGAYAWRPTPCDLTTPHCLPPHLSF